MFAMGWKAYYISIKEGDEKFMSTLWGYEHMCLTGSVILHQNHNRFLQKMSVLALAILFESVLPLGSQYYWYMILVEVLLLWLLLCFDI